MCLFGSQLDSSRKNKCNSMKKLKFNLHLSRESEFEFVKNFPFFILFLRI
jgi:hypothetical protein